MIYGYVLNRLILDLANTLKTITGPLLILVTEKNTLRGEYEKSLAPQSEMVTFRAGHALFRELPEQFNRVMTDFAQKLL